MKGRHGEVEIKFSRHEDPRTNIVSVTQTTSGEQEILQREDSRQGRSEGGGFCLEIRRYILGRGRSIRINIRPS